MNTLDITSWQDKNEHLQEKILKHIKGLHKTLLIMPMPDELLLTQSQFDQLAKLSNMGTMYHSNDRMFFTDWNVMEVKVKGRERLLFTEAHALDELAFRKWEKSVEGLHD
jgi:hypothetical protein